MELIHEELDNGIRKVTLRGRLDILGAQTIDIKFAAITATHKALVLVDLTDVSFLASLGMRTLISSAKALTLRGGHMVMANPQPNVLDVLTVSGLSQLIPTFPSVADATVALLQHAGD